MENKEYLKTLEEVIGSKFIACDSSNIVGYYYNKKTATLWVAFKYPKVYKYTGISETEYQDLCSAESKGKWVNQNLVKTKRECTGYELS